MIESYIIFLYKYGCCDHEYLPISWCPINSRDHTNPKLFITLGSLVNIQTT